MATVAATAPSEWATSACTPPSCWLTMPMASAISGIVAVRPLESPWAG